jgi:hypothetical protein
VDYKPLKLATLQGRGVVEIKENEIKPNETVPGACLSLFTLDQEFVRSVKAGTAGEFKFDGIAPGRYRLIARAPGFCTANIPINLVKASSRSKLRENEIIVHYRLTGIDTCSWGELSKKMKNRSSVSGVSGDSLDPATGAASDDPAGDGEAEPLSRIQTAAFNTRSHAKLANLRRGCYIPALRTTPRFDAHSGQT